MWRRRGGGRVGAMVSVDDSHSRVLSGARVCCESERAFHSRPRSEPSLWYGEGIPPSGPSRLVQSTVDTRESLSPQDGQWLRALKAEVQPITFKKGRECAETRRVFGLQREGDRIRPRSPAPRASAMKWRSSPRTARSPPGAPARRGTPTARTASTWSPRRSIYAARFRPPPPPPKREEPPPAPEPVAEAEVEEEVAVPDLPPGADAASLPALAKVESWLGLSAQPDYEFLYRITPSTTGPGGRHWIIDVRRQDAQMKGPIHVKRLLQAGMRIAPSRTSASSSCSPSTSTGTTRASSSRDEDLADLLDLLRQRRVIYRGTALHLRRCAGAPADPPGVPPGRGHRAHRAALPGWGELPAQGRHPAGGQAHLGASRRRTLHPVEPDFPPRLLRKWLLEPTMSFPASQLDRVLTFFAAHLPRFRMVLKADNIDVDESVEPHFVLTLEGSAEKVKVQLAARYGQTTVPVSPTATHLGYASGVGSESRKLYRRREELERGAGKQLHGAGPALRRAAPCLRGQRRRGARVLGARARPRCPTNWERFGVQAPKVRLRPKLKPAHPRGHERGELVRSRRRVRHRRSGGGSGRGAHVAGVGPALRARSRTAPSPRPIPQRSSAWRTSSKKRARCRAARARGCRCTRPWRSICSRTLGEFTEVEAKARQAMMELRDTNGVPKVAMPEGLKATLRHYQETGLSWLWFLHRHGLSGILADDMGLGKTVQALSAAAEGEQRGGPQAVARGRAHQRARQLGARGRALHAQPQGHGRGTARTARSAPRTSRAWTWSSRSTRWCAATWISSAEVGFRYVILDEAQNIKNADSATAQACKTLPSDTRLALTGTPLENRLSELWSLFDFLMPGFLGSAEGFSDRYEQPIQVANDAEREGPPAPPHPAVHHAPPQDARWPTTCRPRRRASRGARWSPARPRSTARCSRRAAARCTRASRRWASSAAACPSSPR